ncbi:MAG TPA: hypothetical protein VKS19_04530 [Verrucomicrobiae bacterium]|nr:hypothetical protein [Verrucomicrobiae bacterium]
MKTLLTPAILALAGLMLGATLVLISDEPPSISRSFGIPSIDQSFVLSKPAPIYLHQQPAPRLLYPDVPQADPQSLKTFPTGRSAAPSRPVPIYLDKLPTPSAALQPGVYQTYPWTIILVVPGAVTENGDFILKPNTNSLMPIIRPHVEVVPRL